jgi:hypothetical protein
MLHRLSQLQRHNHLEKTLKLKKDFSLNKIKIILLDSYIICTERSISSPDIHS